MNRNEGTLFVGRTPMIPGITLETIEKNPEAVYNKAVDELIKEKVSSFLKLDIEL